MGARSPDIPYPSFTLAMVQSGYSPHSSRKNKKKGARRGRHHHHSHPNRLGRPGEFMTTVDHRTVAHLDGPVPMDVVEVMTAADNLEEAIHSGQATRKLRKLRKRNSLSALVVDLALVVRRRVLSSMGR
ncbi:uncharacterized protein STEHIDRAFT_128954 [Stereum hirsutum FP-91666 SS1]|uniref:uncharacterized protein n=1 Tax=Stereum hirsutum (strain FP-91666) TaxID=721885 RepID=UPI000440F332|nr:uncharacterized protein STEHIDRAFT_128954 [Stereum hirsutum FP-91666 SS1]EIM90094.1 hypothetical protein STEHIDRAFT_128954 [Stereum hirsutum FP-91666 SS1]